MPYRLGIADFNGDGLDDFVSCSRVNDQADDFTYVMTGDIYDLYLTNSDGKMIIVDLNLGNVIDIQKISGNFVSKPFIHNQNLYVIKNGSIIQYN